MSQANRLKLKKSRRDQVKQKYKHGEIQKSGSKKRGYKVRYWNQKTGSWQSTKPRPLVKVNIYNPKYPKPPTRAEKLKKEGMGTWNTNKGNKAYGSKLEDSKMVQKDKPKNNLKVNKEEKKEEKKVVKNEEKSSEISTKKADGNKKKIGPNRYNLKSDSKVHVMKNFIKVDGKLYKTKGPHNNNLKKLLKIRKKNKKK